MDVPGTIIPADEADGGFLERELAAGRQTARSGEIRLPHGLSYSRYLCDYRGIHAEQTLFVAEDDPVEFWDVTVTNNSNRARRLSVYSYCEFSFHQIDMDNRTFR
jgi:cellobiose phosphorylase